VDQITTEGSTVSVTESTITQTVESTSSQTESTTSEETTTQSTSSQTESTNSQTTQSTTTSENYETSSSDEPPPDFVTPPDFPTVPVNFDCPPDVAGNFRHPLDCTRFISCVWGEMFVRDCIDPSLGIILHYNETLDACDWPWSTECLVHEITTEISTGSITESTQTISEESTITGEATLNPPPPGAPGPPIDFECPPGINGNFPHPTDCTLFIMCSNGYRYIMTCINSVDEIILYFDPIRNQCVFPWQSSCRMP
jgi:hypothetical protein